MVATFTDITEKRIIQQQLDLVNNQRTAILANSNAAIAIFKQRRFVEVNTYMAALFGYRPEQLIGQSTRLLHCDDAHYAEFGQHLYSRLAQNHHCALEYAFRHRDGHTVWLYLSVSRLMPDAPADEIALVGVDITERRQMEHVLREERATTQRYLDTMQTVILALDIVGNITMLNRAGCKLLGYTAEEIIGQNWFETCLPQPEGWKVVYPMFKQAIEGCLKGAEYFENAIRRRDGVQHLMAWHNTYLYDNDGVVTGVLCAGENISARKATEHALHQAMQQSSSPVQ